MNSQYSVVFFSVFVAHSIELVSINSVKWNSSLFCSFWTLSSPAWVLANCQTGFPVTGQSPLMFLLLSLLLSGAGVLTAVTM